MFLLARIFNIGINNVSFRIEKKVWGKRPSRNMDYLYDCTWTRDSIYYTINMINLWIRGVTGTQKVGGTGTYKYIIGGGLSPPPRKNNFFLVQNFQFIFKSFQIYMKDLESAESKEKPNFRSLRFLFFEYCSFFLLKIIPIFDEPITRKIMIEKKNYFVFHSTQHTPHLS